MYDLVILPCPRCGETPTIRVYNTFTAKCTRHRCPGTGNFVRILDPVICKDCNRQLDCLTKIEEVIQTTRHRVVRYELSFTFYGGVVHDLLNPTRITLIGRQEEYSARLNGKIYFYYDTFEECEHAAKALRAAFRKVGFRAGMRRGWSAQKGPQRNRTDYYVWADKLSG